MTGILGRIIQLIEVVILLRKSHGLPSIVYTSSIICGPLTGFTGFLSRYDPEIRGPYYAEGHGKLVSR